MGRQIFMHKAISFALIRHRTLLSKTKLRKRKGRTYGYALFYTVKRIVLVLEQWQLKDRTIGLVATIAGSAV